MERSEFEMWGSIMVIVDNVAVIIEVMSSVLGESWIPVLWSISLPK